MRKRLQSYLTLTFSVRLLWRLLAHGHSPGARDCRCITNVTESTGETKLLQCLSMDLQRRNVISF